MRGARRDPLFILVCGLSFHHVNFGVLVSQAVQVEFPLIPLTRVLRSPDPLAHSLSFVNARPCVHAAPVHSQGLQSLGFSYLMSSVAGMNL